MSDTTFDPLDTLGCSHVPSIFEFARLDTVDLTAGAAIRQAVKAARMVVDREASALLLSGRPGCGKSHVAASAAHALTAPSWARYRQAVLARQEIEATTEPDRYAFTDTPRALARRDEDRAWAWQLRECPRWFNVPAMLGRLRREIGADDRKAERELAEFLDAPGAMVLDDLGAEKPSEWSLSILFELVDACYGENRPIIVTSNMSARDLATSGYDRIVSRLADDGVLLTMASAKDYRLRRRKSLA